MDTNAVSDLVKTQIQGMILAAFKEAPQVIDELVKSALSKEVNQHGMKPDYHDRTTMPYLEWIVSDTIREVARKSVSAAVEERRADIEAAVRRAVSADSLVDALVQKILGTIEQDYRVTVKFADDKDL